ncbi:MAG: hypothetical protein OES32_09810 [Acidobacteriota bacterium]|nr:hypothetical protein [Acidobacteriota bacterium]
MHRVHLNPENVPAGLRHLIPLAERFGILDDLDRENLVMSCAPKELEELKKAIEMHDDLLDLWLAGREAAGPEWSEEYLSFSAMRLAADLA